MFSSTEYKNFSSQYNIKSTLVADYNLLPQLITSEQEQDKTTRWHEATTQDQPAYIYSLIKKMYSALDP